MSENELDNIFKDDSCPNCEIYKTGFFASIFCFGFLLLIYFIQLCCGIYSGVENRHLDSDLEFFCNQYHDTQSCSVVYKNDDVVLFDTYNGYVTMENILK